MLQIGIKFAGIQKKSFGNILIVSVGKLDY